MCNYWVRRSVIDACKPTSGHQPTGGHQRMSMIQSCSKTTSYNDKAKAKT